MTATARDLADQLGLKRHQRSWRGDCPACAYRGTFAVREGRDQRPQLFCANCRNRDAITEAIDRVMGGTWTPPDRTRRRIRSPCPRAQTGGSASPLEREHRGPHVAGRNLPEPPRVASLDEIGRAPISCRLPSPGERELSRGDRVRLGCAGAGHRNTPHLPTA